MSDRNAAKQRRQARNRQARQALAARRAAASRAAAGPSTPPPSKGKRSATSTPTGPARSSARRSETAAAPARRRVTPAGEAGPSVGGPDSVAGSGGRGLVDHLRTTPGGLWVALAFLGSLVALLAMAILPAVPRPVLPGVTEAAVEAMDDGPGGAAPLEVPDERFENVHVSAVAPWWVFLVFAIPLAITGIAVAAVRRPRDPSRTWVVCAMALGIVVAPLISFLSLWVPAAAFLGMGAFKARRASQRAGGAADDARPRPAKEPPPP